MREFIVRCENNKFTLEGEIIHCEDCEFCTVEEPISRGIIPDMYCRIWQSIVSTDDSCSYGERKEKHQLSNEGDAESATTTDCISRQEVLRTLHDWVYEGEYKEIADLIESLPPVEPKRPKGEWILECDSEGEGDNLYRCSECGSKYGCQEYDKPNFCLGCGADMRGEK